MKKIQPVTDYTAPQFPEVSAGRELAEHDCSNYDVCHTVKYMCDWYGSCSWYSWTEQDGCFCEDAQCECGDNGSSYPWA